MSKLRLRFIMTHYGFGKTMRVVASIALALITVGFFGCGGSGDKPSFAITQFTATPNPVSAPVAGSPVTLKFTWQIETNKSFIASLGFAPESATAEDLRTTTTQAFVDCAAKCQSGTYESVCTVSTVPNNDKLRFLRCDDPAGLQLAPGRYRYVAVGGTIASGLNNEVAQDERTGILEIR
jgi:hypothetical protein